MNIFLKKDFISQYIYHKAYEEWSQKKKTQTIKIDNQAKRGDTNDTHIVAVFAVVQQMLMFYVLFFFFAFVVHGGTVDVDSLPMC